MLCAFALLGRNSLGVGWCQDPSPESNVVLRSTVLHSIAERHSLQALLTLLRRRASHDRFPIEGFRDGHQHCGGGGQQVSMAHRPTNPWTLALGLQRFTPYTILFSMRINNVRST
ncbi:hypothetical protein N656DRAFT_555956 [Canariomyces notabilis]|uniref:Secreted protein n=1 Tax=Canariomyces notabilis TaxID=2074819 RepID=A0AAN6TI45_9PEZI|nr:hypothetical protein N656DRAFT_555956 [Canariomyces arenarius]